jgi:lysophospholipase L1-like esterase
MRRPVAIALAVALGVLVLASSGSAAAGALRPIVWSQERVLVIGDSLAEGLAPPLEQALRARGVAAFRSIAVGGTMINHWAWSGSHWQARSLDAALAEFQPTLVLISLGTNDEASRGVVDHKGDPAKPPYGPGYSVARARKDSIPKLASKLAGLRSVWIGPPVTGRWIPDRAFRDLIAANWPGRYFNTESIALSKQPDDLHMTGSGYRTWSDAIIAWLETGA